MPLLARWADPVAKSLLLGCLCRSSRGQEVSLSPPYGAGDGGSCERRGGRAPGGGPAPTMEQDASLRNAGGLACSCPSEIGVTSPSWSPQLGRGMSSPAAIPKKNPPQCGRRRLPLSPPVPVRPPSRRRIPPQCGGGSGLCDVRPGVGAPDPAPNGTDRVAWQADWHKTLADTLPASRCWGGLALLLYGGGQAGGP